jgi:hypothetical protein
VTRPNVYFDTSAQPGEKLAPEVRAEIAKLVPPGLDDGEVTTSKLVNGAVTAPKIADGSVTSEKIGAGQVVTAHLADRSVGTAQLAAGAVTAAKAGPGVVTAHNPAGTTAIALDVAFMSDDAYAAISHDSDTLYATHA